MPVTLLYAGLLGLIYVAFSIAVIKRRRASKVPIGTADNDTVTRYVRAHANFAEYVPLALILIGALEGVLTPHWLLHMFGVMLIIGRLSHAYGLTIAEPKTGNYSFRITGMMLTFAVLGVSAIVALLKAVPILLIIG